MVDQRVHGWGDRVDQGDTQWGDVISAYRRYYKRSQGDREDRLRAEQEDWWAWEAVDDAVRGGTIPLTVLDALVCDPDGDSEYRAYVAAGPLEDSLKWHSDRYARPFADRGRTNDAWADALRGVWLDAAEWAALPDDLRRLVPQPATTDAAGSVRRRRVRRPSKRQGSGDSGRGR